MLRNHTFCTRFRAFRPARLVSLLLAALLVFSALPAGASGLSAGEGAESGTMAPEAVISAEDISRRGDFEKHYLLSDGSFVAVSYADVNDVLYDKRHKKLQKRFEHFKKRCEKRLCAVFFYIR